MARGFSGCVVCGGKRGQPRNGKRGRTCSANSCKREYRDQRAEQPTMGLGDAVQQPVADRMPDGMWVHEIEEILGERCCEPHKMSKKKRKNGPGSAYRQRFLVRGTFLEEDGDDDDDDEDSTPEPNTFWVDKFDVLETISIEDVKAALRARHEAVLEDL